MAETFLNSPIMNRKERGKFSSLNNKEVKLVLETYVKRTLSNPETERTVERKEKRLAKFNQSLSDFSKFRFKTKENKTSAFCRLRESKREDGDLEIQEIDQPAATDNVKATKMQSWFKKLLNNLFKRADNEQTETVIECDTPSGEVQARRPSKAKSFRKSSLRKLLSFKRESVDEDKKLKPPNYLPLKRTNKPSTWENNEDSFYQQVSSEIELLVHETDCRGSEDKSPEAESADSESQDTDDVIKKIVSILQKEGDALNRKIKEDPKFNSFFSDISYSSFKKLADVYVNKEIRRASLHASPEDIKFAFSIHFTKQVVGISPHPANRIMGFGNRYLQDTFTWLSRSRDNLDVTVSETCLSPD